MLPYEARESIIVNDKTLIHKFVTALQLAVDLYQPTRSPGEEVGKIAREEAAAATLSDGILRLHIKVQKAPLHDLQTADKHSDLVFLFRSSSQKYCFGDKFQRCLREMGSYQAEKLRQRVAKIAPDVVAFRIGDYNEVRYLAPRLNEPATVKTLLTALSHSDERLFVGINKKTGDKATTQTLILLELKDGSTAELDLMLAPLSRNINQTPEWLKNLYRLLEQSRPEPNL